MGTPHGFDYVTRGADVVITHHGRRTATLRGRTAQDSLEDVTIGDPQELMARLTGNYKHGNERRANKWSGSGGSGRGRPGGQRAAGQRGRGRR